MSASGSWLAYRQSGLGLWFWTSAAVFLFFLTGLVDALVSRLVLDEDALHVIELLSRRSYPRAEILEVKSEKGCPIALKLATKGWVKLPMMVAVHPNTIRAWVKG